mmetsp:Transcript_13834/g.20247  ORF Transcript_13834/g.20247 Transcript_13834/m.20247 type:complete len:305 (-) Transcript_13834:120-1034(-)|eukprot:CAMPEP_0194049188 /NCGR_PEP_ID=MMETSP0009_2-20130614/29961_1 /TAXON_ID=210454 /ORGANISM="Grammatophora oceanica, Strain CCMP 410" /LENGTH=304 /DNA_ID=CAMNT_0038695279 /DNA_START=109 /DNA_END=1023 /DNA_ORIENTATION=-
MSVTSTVNEIKSALSQCLPIENLEDNDADVERCSDLLKRLDEQQNITLKVLADTLIGTVVSKFKAHETLGPTAKALVKKWKKQAKNAGAGGSKKPAAARRDSEATKLDAATAEEWAGLPPLRKNICTKMHSLLDLSTKELLKNGINKDAVMHLCVSRASEIEMALHTKWGVKGDRSKYTEKARSLCFNIKKNAQLRHNILMGGTGADELILMSSDQLATAEKLESRNAAAKKLSDSRRLDWEEANESKINEMCGIKGDLLQASLFTCGRCKSTKTTSTQKQTRSADEPMTVFVLCMNCGNRWKC